MAVHDVEVGGYNLKFIKPVPKQLYCTVCTKVFRDPHLTGCCGQHYCESCLKYWFRKQKKTTCPHCRHDNFNHMLNKALKREVDELEILCIKQEVGCQWVGELSSLQTHLNSDEGCEYADVQCSNKCGAMMMRKELEAHLAQQCPLRKIQCQYCHYEDTYQTITTQHYDECPSFPLPCPNNCGTIGIRRAAMANHLSRCELEPVECPFHEAGCTTRLVRREFDVHMSENQPHHLLVLLRAFQMKKQELSESQRQLGECQKQLGECQKELHKTKLELQDLEAIKSVPKTLKDTCDHVTFFMPYFSMHKQNGKVWYSPPFYFDEGYKLCVAVYANGKGAGAGTHVSVELLQMRGEHDDKLNWGEEGQYYHKIQSISIEMVAQCKEAQSEKKQFSLEHHLCSECFSPLPPHEDLRVCQSWDNIPTTNDDVPIMWDIPISKDKFIDHHSAEQLMALNDTILLRFKKC